jgi:hypothetical protein
VLPDKGLAHHAKLEAIVRRALASDKDARYPSAGAMLRDLEEYLGESGQLASRLKLGEWIQTTFGTALVEKRRESERRLPKSNPPPRSSERMRTSGATSGAPLAAAGSKSKIDELVSDGAMRAFKKDLESSRVSMDPGSLAGSAIDVVPTSSGPVLTRVPDALPIVRPAARRHPAVALMAMGGIALIVAALVALLRRFVQ